MEKRFGLIVGCWLAMSMTTECFSSEVLKLDGIGNVGVRSLGKTRFVPDQLGDIFEIDRPIAPRNQSAEDSESTAAENDSLPDLNAEPFNLKLLSQQNLVLDANDAEVDQKSVKFERPGVLKTRVLIFKASWCGACQALNYEWPKLEAVKWKVGSGEQSHFQLVDADERPDLMTKYGVSSLPTIIRIENEQEVSRHGLLGAFNLAELYYGRLK